MQHINLAIAFAAGVLGFFSPCVVPLIPGYLSFISGVSLADLPPAERRRRRAPALRLFTGIGGAVPRRRGPPDDGVQRAACGEPLRARDPDGQRRLPRRHGRGAALRPGVPAQRLDPRGVPFPAWALT